MCSICKSWLVFTTKSPLFVVTVKLALLLCFVVLFILAIEPILDAVSCFLRSVIHNSPASVQSPLTGKEV